MKVLVLAMMVVGCGSYTAYRPVNENVGEKISDAYHFNKDAAGEQANFARKNLSDKGFTVEGANDRAVDKGFTKETTQDKLTATRDNAGEKANDKRKGLYRKGIQEMRHGDAERNSQVAQDNRDQDASAAKQAKTESDKMDAQAVREAERMSLIESTNELQALTLEAYGLRLDALEANDIAMLDKIERDLAVLELRVKANEIAIAVLQADEDLVCSVIPGTVDVTFRDNSYHYDHNMKLKNKSQKRCIDVNHDGTDVWGIPSWAEANPSTETVCFTDKDKYLDIDWDFHYRTDSKTISVPVPTVVCPN